MDTKELRIQAGVLLDQAQTVDGLIMAVTEDIPEDRWRQNCWAIMDGLDRHVKAHPEQYA